MEETEFSRRLHALTFFPSGYCDASWREQVIAYGLFEKLKECPRTKGRLESYLCQAFELPAFIPTPDIGWQEKLCLMDAPALLSVLKRLSLIYYSKDIASRISGDEVRQIRQVLGEEDYLFCLHQAPLMLSLEENVRVFDPTFGADEYVRGGVQRLSAIWQKLDPAFLKRIMLKLPRDYQDDFQESDFNLSEDEAKRLLQRIIRETCPSWRVIFN
ncbi:SctK family type III secretion system sorting platform protein [Terasakiella pusilla]|uniref:SctK family type III secretion system sorting platform protein n=1 Tax=Terasakiella pusilla TaxID=64973 RepID=UPI003AA98B4E